MDATKRHVVTKYINGYQLHHPKAPYGAKFYQDALTDGAKKAGLHSSVGGPLPPNQLSHALRHARVVYLLTHGFTSHAAAAWVGDAAKTIDLSYAGITRDTKNEMALAIGAEHLLMG